MRRMSLFAAAPLLLCAFLAVHPPAVGASTEEGHKGTIGPTRTKETAQINRVTRILNRAVINKDGQPLGTISDVVLGDQGAPDYVILSGPGDKLYPIPLQALKQTTRGGRLVLSLGMAGLRNAPSFAHNNWPDLSGPEWESKIFSYYEEQLSFETLEAPSETEMPPGKER